MISWAAARVTAPGGCTPVVAGETYDSTGVLTADGVAQLLGLATQLAEVGPLGKRS